MSNFSFKQLQEQAKESGIGEPVPAGRYTVKVVEANAAKTKDGSKDKIDVKFTILEGPHANRKLFNQYVISPENNTALAFFFKHMAAFGLRDDFFSANPSMQEVASVLVNKVVDVTVVIDTWDNQDRNKIKDTFPSASPLPSAGSAAAMPSSPF